MEQIIKIAVFILNSFVHIWPYLLITIPLAVAVQVSGAAKFINIALSKNPFISILLATIVGAFSPFCSCGVIPVITSLLIGGVPLAPVMSFWIASPSMDPEIFFLSTTAIGWELSVWRLVATFVISLSSGYITHFAIQKGYLGKDFLLAGHVAESKKPGIFSGLKFIGLLINIFNPGKPSGQRPVQLMGISSLLQPANINCCISPEGLSLQPEEKNNITCKNCNCPESAGNTKLTFRNKLLHETWKATAMVIKFMALAFFINSLITFYVPKEFISNLIGGNGPFSVIVATLVGIPAYTSNITALPLISGLLALGMNKGAALAFLITGPTTTLPAMMAVWGIVKRKIFFLYVSFALFGALLFGLLYNFIN